MIVGRDITSWDMLDVEPALLWRQPVQRLPSLQVWDGRDRSWLHTQTEWGGSMVRIMGLRVLRGAYGTMMIRVSCCRWTLADHEPFGRVCIINGIQVQLYWLGWESKWRSASTSITRWGKSFKYCTSCSDVRLSLQISLHASSCQYYQNADLFCTWTCTTTNLEPAEILSSSLGLKHQCGIPVCISWFSWLSNQLHLALIEPLILVLSLNTESRLHPCAGRLDSTLLPTDFLRRIEALPPPNLLQVSEGWKGNPWCKPVLQTGPKDGFEVICANFCILTNVRTFPTSVKLLILCIRAR